MPSILLLTSPHLFGRCGVSEDWILNNFQVESMVMAVGPSVLTYMQFHSSQRFFYRYCTFVRDRSRFFVWVGQETTCASSVDKPFSLKHVIVRPTKVIINLKIGKLWFSKKFFSVESQWNLSDFFFFEYIFFEIFDLWNTLFSKNVSNFCQLCFG